MQRPSGTFLDAHYPRPVSGCAAEVSQRIAEAVFLALVQAIPDKVTAAPAGSSGNFALGGFDPGKGAGYVMYQISGGGYGGNCDHDGLSNGCSTIGISKSQPVEVLEQYYPILFRRFALREGSGGAGKHRGGFGVHYEVELLRGEARASFVMDHGRFGPPGVIGGADGGPNVVKVHRGRETLIPEHLSKDQDIPLQVGDRVEVMTPGGGGYGDPFARDPALVARDVRRGYYTAAEVRALFGVALGADGAVDAAGDRCDAPAEPARGVSKAMLVYHRPPSLQEALQIRAGSDVIVLAGGTDVYPAKAARAGWGDMAHKDVLDIGALSGLRGIVEEEAHWRIGALTTWTDLIDADLPPLLAGLQLAAREIGGAQIQNRGTLAGNICTASPAGDGAPNLLVLEARVELASLGATRLLRLAEFITGYRHTACRSDEIVTAILIPKRGAARGHFRKLGARKYLVISIVMVAGVVETDHAGNVSSARPCHRLLLGHPATFASPRGGPGRSAAGGRGRHCLCRASQRAGPHR